MLQWISVEGEVYAAETMLGEAGMMHLAVESLGEMGWDWHVWEAAGRVQQRYGLADTLEEAMAKAERVLAEVMAQSSRAA